LKGKIGKKELRWGGSEEKKGGEIIVGIQCLPINWGKSAQKKGGKKIKKGGLGAYQEKIKKSWGGEKSPEGERGGNVKNHSAKSIDVATLLGKRW